MITPAYAPTATERVLPRLALDFTTGVLDPRVTVTRALDTATAVNSSGYVATVNANLPRFDFDSVTLAPRGLLIEETRANLTLNSSNLSAVSWSLLRATNTQNSGTAPDNTNTANLLLDTATSGTHVAIQLFIKAASPIAYSASIFLKAGVRTRGEFRMTDQAGNGTRVTFNLSNGTVGTPTVFGTGFTLGSASVVALRDGWYRVILTTTSNSATTLGLETYIANDALAISYVGNGSGFFVWGAQLEAGAFATSYIPTVASTVTRNADVVSMTGTNFSSWYNASEGAFLTKFSFPSIPASQFRYVLAANDGTATNFIAIAGNTTSNVPAGRVIASSSTQASMGGGAITANQEAIGVLAYKQDSFAYGQNGATLGTDATGLVPTVNRLDIGALGSSFACAHIQRIAYWPQRIINNETLSFSK
jgi:hypothetical protein